MILIIDGYNVLKQVQGHKSTSHHELKVFVDELAGYFKRRGLEATVVFDGGPTPYPDATHKPFGHVVYSGYKECADTLIKRFLDDYKGREVVLISSDRALRDYAHERGFESLGGQEFYHDYVRKIHRNPPVVDQGIHKLATDTDPELDALMMEAARMTSQKDGQADMGVRHAKTQTLAKKERKRLKILDKL